MVLNDYTTADLHKVVRFITFLLQLLLELQAAERQIWRVSWVYESLQAVFDTIPCLAGMWHRGATGECTPQALTTSWGMPQPAPVISSTALPEWLWRFWNHLHVYTVFNGSDVCATVFCFSAKVLSTLYFSLMFFFTVQELNNALCFPVV